jgi:hypothetical protein
MAPAYGGKPERNYPILAANSYRKFDAALDACERLSFLGRYNQQA